MKKVISIVLAAVLGAGCVPVMGAGVEEPMVAETEVEIEEAVTPVPVAEIEVDSDTDVTEDIETDYDDPIVHEETVDNMFEFPEGEENLIREPLPEPGEINFFAFDEEQGSWESVYTAMFGDDYLTPYKKHEDGQTVSGNTNRLVIEETDLSLPGKNGLDLVLKRKYDNQDYNDVFTVNDNGYAGKSAEYDRYIYAFTNMTTYETVYIGFLTPDQMYENLYNGFYMNKPVSVGTVSATIDGRRIEYYEYEKITGNISDNTEYDRYEYDNSEEPMKHRQIVNGLRYTLFSRKMLMNKGSLSDRWYLMLPEAYSYRYSYESAEASYGSYYYEKYSGAFRDIEGNIYSFSDDKYYRKYDGETNISSYSSKISISNCDYLEAESFYETQKLDGNGPDYNFVVYDGRGLTYYMYDTGWDNNHKPIANHRIYIVAVEDLYGNKICYEYNNDYEELTKIIDTYGREININTIDNGKQISYYDETAGETKTITYTTETLPSSALNNDSTLKGKDIHRFTVTNQEGEKTIYDSRETENINYYCKDNNVNYDLYKIPNPPEDLQTTTGYNIERIIYPTGSETRYKYKSMYTYNANTMVRRGIYAVEKSYDIVDGKMENQKEYSFSNEKSAMTIKRNNISENTSTIMQYNKNALLREENTTGYSSGVSKSKLIEYKYNDNDKPIEVKSSWDLNNVTMTYEYFTEHPGIVEYESNEQYGIKYEYYMRPYTILGSGETGNIQTDMIKSITYTDVTGDDSVEDYKITTTLTADNKNIEYERIEQNGVIKSQLKYEYDSEGNVISVKQWTNDTNSDGKLDENDEVIELDSSYVLSAQNLLTVTDSVQNVTNADGENEGSVAVEYSYNMSGMPLSRKDPYGAVTTIEYDGINRPVKYTMANGGIRQVEYNTAQKLTTITDEAGVVTRYETDGFGRNKAKYVKDGSSYKKLEEYAYDSAGRLSEKKTYRSDYEGTREKYEYDIFGRISSVNLYSLTGGFISRQEYEYGNKKVTQTTSANGASAADQISYYDSFGNLIKTESKSGSTVYTTQYENDYMGRPVKMTDPNGNETVYEYTYDGKVKKQTNAEGDSESIVYDLAGRVLSVIDANGNATNTMYDKLGRTIKVTSPFNIASYAETKTYYDKNSNVVKTAVKKAAGVYMVENYSYDVMGNLIAQTANDGKTDIVTQYNYDIANRITKKITGLSEYSENPSGGAVTQYSYNNLGFLSQITDPMGMTESYNYDYAGNVISTTDKNNNTMLNVYGDWGLEKSYFNGLSESKEYEYNGLGQLIGTRSVNADQSVSEESYSYDAFGRMISKTSSDGSEQFYSYDPVSNLTAYTLKKDGTVNNSIEYTYNSINRLTQLNNNGIITSYEYDANGNLIEKTLDNGITTDYTYNKAGKLVNMKTMKNNTVYNYSECEYSQNGQIDKVTFPDGEDNYESEIYYYYDGIGRLKEEFILDEAGEGYYYQYEYDLNGNRIKKKMNKNQYNDAGEINYTYDMNNRLLSEEINVENEDSSTETTTVRYYYDNNGNITAKQSSVSSNGGMALSGRSSDSGMEIYRYDAFNRLINYNSGSTEASYKYNADNLRTQKTVNRAITDYVWNGQNLAAEYNSGDVNTYTYDMNGVHIAKQIGTVSVYIKDYHGNIVGKANASGDMTTEPEARTEYDSFGNIWEGDSPDPFGYCGEYLDSESGLVYLRNRYYDSSTGRFITEDPAQDGLNWYVYGKNNPLMFIDPWGLAAGDDFYSVDDLLTDAYECYYGITDYTKLEIGSVIYTYKRVNEETGEQVTVYSYTEPRMGDLVSINLKECESDLEEGQELFGYIHSHSKINDDMDYVSNTFSKQDKSFINSEKEKDTPLYLMTPNGEIRALYATGTGEIASNSNARYPGYTVLTGLNFKAMNAFEKVQMFMVSGKMTEEAENIIRKVLDDSKITENDTWYSAEDIQNLQVVRVYNALRNFEN